jgi:hypothetical protein
MRKFIRDLYYAAAAGALIGGAIGIYRRHAQEHREAQARQSVPPVITPPPYNRRPPRRQRPHR